MERRPGFTRRYGFVLVTLAFFIVSWAGQLVTQLMVVMEEAGQHGQAFEWGEFWAQFWQSTFENWQSEFLQLIWQALGLKLLLCWGSSQSREGDQRIEAKVDALCREAGMNPEAIGADANAES